MEMAGGWARVLENARQWTAINTHTLRSFCRAIVGARARLESLRIQTKARGRVNAAAKE